MKAPSSGSSAMPELRCARLKRQQWRAYRVNSMQKVSRATSAQDTHWQVGGRAVLDSIALVCWTEVGEESLIHSLTQLGGFSRWPKSCPELSLNSLRTQVRFADSLY